MGRKEGRVVTGRGGGEEEMGRRRRWVGGRRRKRNLSDTRKHADK